MGVKEKQVWAVLSGPVQCVCSFSPVGFLFIARVRFFIAQQVHLTFSQVSSSCSFTDTLKEDVCDLTTSTHKVS